MKDYPTLAIPLTEQERDTLTQYESYLEDNLPIFFEVGKVLVTIRNQKLYREQYRTFKDYCRTRWNISRPRAYQLIDAAEVKEDLSTSCRQKSLPEPERESQTRALKSAPKDQRPEAWETAVGLAGGKQPSATHIRQAIQDVLPMPEPEPEPERSPQIMHTWNGDKISETTFRFPNGRTLRSGEYYETTTHGIVKILDDYDKDSHELHVREMTHKRQKWVSVDEIRASCTEDYMRMMTAPEPEPTPEPRTLPDTRRTPKPGDLKRDEAQEQTFGVRVERYCELVSTDQSPPITTQRPDDQPDAECDTNEKSQMYKIGYWEINVPNDIEIGTDGELFRHSRQGEYFINEATFAEKQELRARHWSRLPKTVSAPGERATQFCVSCKTWTSSVYAWSDDTPRRGICQSCASTALRTLLDTVDESLILASTDRNRIIRAGLRLFRPCGTEKVLKEFTLANSTGMGDEREITWGTWKTMEKFSTKTALKARIKALEQEPDVIFDGRI